MSAFAIDFPGKVREIVTNVAFSPAFSTVDVRQDAVVCRAFWDTGANGSVISTKVVSALGLKPINKSEVFTANGSYVASVYVVDVMLPNRFVIPKVTVTESDLTDCDALIGMDIITLGDMIVSNNPNTRFSFRIPSEGVAGFTSAHEVIS